MTCPGGHDDFDMAHDGRADTLTKLLCEQPLMEAQAWHGWATYGKDGSVNMVMVGGPTRHAGADVFGMTYVRSWTEDPGGDAERQLGMQLNGGLVLRPI